MANQPNVPKTLDDVIALNLFKFEVAISLEIDKLAVLVTPFVALMSQTITASNLLLKLIG